MNGSISQEALLHTHHQTIHLRLRPRLQALWQ